MTRRSKAAISLRHWLALCGIGWRCAASAAAGAVRHRRRQALGALIPSLLVSGAPHDASWDRPDPPCQDAPRPVSVSLDPVADDRPDGRPSNLRSLPPQGSWLVAGLVAGLLVVGAGGFFVGRCTAPAGTVAARPTPSAAAPALSVFHRAQEAANRRTLAPGLNGIAAPWLPYLGDCTRNGEGAVKLGRGEKARLRCHHGDVVVTFVEYQSTAERDKARSAKLGQNVEARRLTPGVAAPREGFTPSGRMAGDYLEYAYTVKVGTSDGPVGALWWDDRGAPVGAYLAANWREKMAGSWEPLRDLWAAHA